MKKFRDLNDFVTYCESVNNRSNDFYLLSSLIQLTANEDELMYDIYECLEEYYFFLRQAVDAELYLLCGIIFSASEVEIAEYKQVCKQILGKSYAKTIDHINLKLKEKFL